MSYKAYAVWAEPDENSFVIAFEREPASKFDPGPRSSVIFSDDRYSRLLDRSVAFGITVYKSDGLLCFRVNRPKDRPRRHLADLFEDWAKVCGHSSTAYSSLYDPLRARIQAQAV